MDQRCRLPPMSVLEGVTQPGDIMIGVLLSVHFDKIYQKLTFSERPPKILCTLFSLDNYHLTQTMIHTIEEINRDLNILPNVTLGFQMYDTCNVPHKELQGSLQFLTEFTTITSSSRCSSRPSFPAIIGSTLSANSIILAHVLGTFRYPQVSPYSSASLLSNQKMFPSFFRPVPSDKTQSMGLALLVLNFNWTWIGFVATDNDYGILGIQIIKQEIIKAGACVAFTEYIHLGQPDRNAPHIVKVIKESSAKVVVVFSADHEFVPVANEMLKQNITGRIFIGNAGWVRTTLLSTRNYFCIFSGTLGLTANSYLVPGLSQYLSKIHPPQSMRETWENLYWENLYWENVFSCKFLYGKNLTSNLEAQVTECTGEENDVLAKALDDLRSCKMGDGPFSHGTCADILNFKPWQVHATDEAMLIMDLSVTEFARRDGLLCTNGTHWLFAKDSNKEVPRSVCSESCPAGYRKAARSGYPICCFDCVQCLQGEISNQTDSINCLRCPWNQWPNSEKSRCLQKSVEFLSYEDTLGGPLATISIISSLIPAAILRLFILHRQTSIVKANNYSLSCLLLMSLCLCFLCSLVFIGYPHHQTCLLRQVLFGLAFTLCVSSILAKTILVVLAFMASRPGRNLRKWMNPQVSYMIIITCFLLQLILCITWLSIASPFPQYNTETKHESIIAECNEGSPIAFWTMLGYLFLLATISFIVAFLARNLPDRFNEAKFITFSMLAFLSVWVSFIPVSLSAQGKYMVAMEIFAILASSWALVICMFLPKCFIIVFRPDQNSQLLIMKIKD
ncbi:extracellular calcium-sensing receptor-like [Pseudophryne corroboree]|uniref:extracellular calcium-sensing receptor-like n=1 Tax=Pseudophryne corroboree TaxID=495146 RepID=UPI00308157CB